MRTSQHEFALTDRSTPGSATPPRLAQTAASWVAYLAIGDVSEAEMSRLRTWLEVDEHRRAFEEARRVWRLLPDVDGAATSTPSPRRPRRRPAMAMAAPAKRQARRTAAIGGLAASLIAALWVGQAGLGDVHTDKGQVRRVRLADGTTAWLDTDSAVNLRYSAGERRVELVRGRAWFDVVHDPARPFRVVAPGGVVTDLGTAFEVERASGEVRVGVSQGVVTVQGGGSMTRVSAGQSTAWRQRDGRLANTTPFAADDALAWRSGRIVLDRVPLLDALDQIRRYRPGLILVLDDKAARAPISGALFTDRLDQGLDTLAASMDLRVTRLPYLVILGADDRRFGHRPG